MSPSTLKNWVSDCLRDGIASDSTPHFVVGLSSGLDSVVLTHLVWSLGFQLTAVHVNYKQRGAASDGDESFAEDVCQKLGVSYRSFEFPDPDVKQGNFQERARLFRRQCFEEVLQQSGAHAILLAHHFDDQTETIVHKLFRGAGTASLSGMEVYDPPYLRPLLDVDRETIQRYAIEHQLQWREDRTNAESIYTRNWIRNVLSPQLDEQFPGWDSHLQAHARRIRATQELADRWLDLNGITGYSFPLDILYHISEELGYLITHHWLTSHHVFPTSGQITHIMQLLDSQPGAFVKVGDHIRVVRERSSLDLVRTEVGPDGVDPQFVIETLSQLTEFEVNHQLAGGTKIALHLLERDVTASTDVEYHPDQLYLDANKIIYPLIIRPWQEGDRIQPLGLEGTKLVSDVLTDQKIASGRKKQAYVVSHFEGRACAIIFPHPTSRGLSGSICHENRITQNTTSILNIKIQYPS